MTLPRVSSSGRRLLAAGAAAALALTLLQATQSAQAANPDSGTVKPTDRTASWSGQYYAAGATVDPAACPPKAVDVLDAVCDHYTLKVPVKPAYWDGRDGGAEVTIQWQDPDDDFDMYIYKGDDLVASSAQGGTNEETALIAKASGTYEVRVLPFLVTDSGYQGTATFRSGPDVAPPLGGPAEYHGKVFRDFACSRSNLPCLPDREPQNTPIDSPFPSLALKMGPVGREAAEPTIGVDKRGRAFYAAATFDGAGGFADTRLLRSTNDGRTWGDVTPTVDPPLTLDPYVYVEEDSGRVFNLDLYLGSSFLSFSDDGGRTYETNPAASGNNIVNDHQTLFAGPLTRQAKNLGLRTTDPEFPEAVYYCFNRVSDSSCSRSLDGGRTFASSGEPPYPGVEPKEGGAFCGGLHGHVATDRDGRVFLPKGHCNRPYVAKSTDAGITWSRRPVSDRIDMPDNQSAIASDRRNNLYYVWYDSKHRLPWLAISKDHGRTWGDPIMIAPPNVREVQWPTVAAGGAGRVAITFPGTTEKDQGDLTRPWDYYVVTSVNALSSNPTFVSNIANPATDPVHRGECPGRCGNMFDFLDVVVSPAAGHAVWATVTDTCTALSSCKSDPDAIGFDGDDDNAARDMKGIFVRQVGGPRIGW
ncbi:MAG: glycoside hydrolase [Actinomycetota bacterium]|nr:glycoside hydrolase [Actinomycetota bacterium]